MSDVKRLSPKVARRYALYVRVSDAKQLAGVEYNSLASQEDMLRRWVSERPGGPGEVYRVYTDVESGTKIKRDGLLELIADARAKKFDEALAYNSDRWCRSMEIHVEIKRITRECGVRFTSTTQDFGDEPEGQLLDNQIASINQFYSALIGKKVRAKRLARVERGEWNGGPAPYGYTSEAGRLIVVAEEARVVRQIFDLWLEHPSPAEVRNRLEALGIRDRQGRVWSSSVLHYMIQNRTYVGEVRHHDIVRPGLHEALVPREVWDAAQKLLATRTRLAPSTYKRAYPLKGLLRCGRCGVGMKAHWAQGRNKIRHPRYRCERTFKRDWSGCPIKELRAEPIEAWVQGQLDALRLRPELIETILAGVNAASGERVRPLRDKERVIEARMAEVGSQIDNLVGAIASGGSGFQSIRSALLLAERNKEQLATERDALKRQIEREAGEPIDPARVRGNLEDFQLLYGAATDEERGELLRLLIKEIVVEPAEETGPGRKIAIHFWATVNLPRGGSIYRQNWLPELGSNQRPTD